jgi:hypothetical protein
MTVMSDSASNAAANTVCAEEVDAAQDIVDGETGNQSDSERETTHARATLDAWRAQGADRLDPVRFALIDALEMRAHAHAGAARRVLDARIDGLLTAYAAEVERAASNTQTRAEDAMKRSAQAPAPLAALTGGADRAARNEPPPELLDYFRDVWSKLSADQQVQQSLDQVPKNAGPLNSSSLVHRALLLMRELSPAYLRQFLAYADALSWLEDLNAAGAVPAAKEAPRGNVAKPGARATTKTAAKKSTRARSR